MSEQNEDLSSIGSIDSLLDSLQNFKALYYDQLQKSDDTYDGLKLRVTVLQKWVSDLIDQNEILVKYVGELQADAFQRLTLLEATTTIADSQQPQISMVYSGELLSAKGINRVEGLCQELDEVKKQLSEKEKLVAKYQCRIEELRGCIEDKSADDKVFIHRSSMTELCDRNLNQEQKAHSSVKKELEITQVQLCQMEKEVSQLKKKLKDADCNVKRLRSDLVASEKNAREMRSALTAEVAEKHDEILALRREVATLEDKLRQADMQTHFKDDIIKELRKEVKVARSKETLVEVLGIKERSLSHMEHLTEQLEQKEQTIGCLESELQQYREAPNALYRVRQQVDWFTENISQQCASGNVPEEFKKCITTMLEELRESIECCNLSPSNAGPCKDSIDLVKAAQTNFDQSRRDLSQSWTSIWDTVHELDSLDLSQQIEQWKKCLTRQRCIQQKVQELIQSIKQTISSSTIQTGSILNSVNALHSTLCSLVEELNQHTQQRDVTSWLKKLNQLVAKSLSNTQEISCIAANNKSGEKKIKNLVSETRNLDVLEQELVEVIKTEHKVYEKLCKLEKTQRMKTDTLLATVLHHQEMWAYQQTLSDDMKIRILHLVDCLKQQANKIVLQPKECKKFRQDPVEHSLNIKSRVTQISSEIRSSISGIEQKQNQVSSLEVDLSTVRVVLDTAQQEINVLSKECNSKDFRKRVTSLLKKLEKQITNALTKAANLASVYQATKEMYANASQHVLQLQREFDSLEEELHSSHYYHFQESSKPDSPTCEKRSCVSQTELNKYKKKRCGPDDRQNQEVKLQHIQYEDMQKALIKKEDVLRAMKDNILELKHNLNDRDCMAANHEETIYVLQNSLKISQKEVEELHRKVTCLEMKNTAIEKDCKKQIQCFQNEISDLQKCLKQSEDSTLQLRGGVSALCKLMFAELKVQYLQSLEESLQDSQSMRSLQNANLELATLAGHLQEDCRSTNCKLSEAYKHMANMEKKHQKAEAALQIVICNLKERFHTEQNKLCELIKVNKQLQEQLTSSSNAYKKELEDKNHRLAASYEENMSKNNELKKQIKSWSAKVSDLEVKLANVQEKFRESTTHEKRLEQELSSLEAKCKEEVSLKQREVSQLSNLVKTMTEKLEETTTELELERVKYCESEQKLQAACAAYDELKVKAKDKEMTAEKLHVALTQLSNKFVSRRLDSKVYVRKYQEECAKFEALYNTTACKLRCKEEEMSSMIQEMDRMRAEIDQLTLSPLLQKEDDQCPFLLGRVQQLSKELQIAHSCQNSYETRMTELTERCSEREEEITYLKSQIKQVTMQKDKLLCDVEKAQEEIIRLQVTKSNLQETIKKIEQSKNQITEQMKNMQRLMCEGQSLDAGLQPNIELQREISSTLSSQLRSVKQKLHATRHDYKQLQIAYDEVKNERDVLKSERINILIQKGERDLEQTWKDKPHCVPCAPKACKSTTHLKSCQDINDRGHYWKYTSHSKSLHKLKPSKEFEQKEKIWKETLERCVRRENRGAQDMNNSSSSN